MGAKYAGSMGRNEIDVAGLIDTFEHRYGPPPSRPRFEPMDELVSCILSQHTADTNSLPAFFRLKEAFPTWEDVVEAGAERVADVIRQAGLANQKARSILGALAAIRDKTGSYGIDHLGRLPMHQARDWLEELPGVGPKTASIVLCFSFGMEAVPVDTHVFRVAKRLGLIPAEMGADAAHDALLHRVPPGMAYRFHMALIGHGRAVCRASRPRCGECELASRCPWTEKSTFAKGPIRKKAVN